jgi:glycolate oxidase subunit GlcD
MAKKWTKEIKEVVGKDSSFDHELDLICYSRDMSVHYGMPDLVVFATTTKEVSDILRIANKNKVPVVVRGSGTSVTGAIVPINGGIVLDLTRMNEIKAVRKGDGCAVVEPGVICQNFNASLAPTHFFPPDPGSSSVCTLGGMVATNASGTRALKYGTTRDWVMGLEVVLADGEVMRTGTYAPKTSSGYDLTRLFCCSEGTLGVITEIVLKVIPVPQFIAFASASFKTLGDVARAVSDMLSSGVRLSACEILDAMSIEVVNKATKLGLPQVEAMLFVEVDGKEEAVRDEMSIIEEICESNNGFDVAWSDDPKDRQKLWAARGALVPSLSRFRSGHRLIPIAEDFGVPISRVPIAIKGAQKISKKHNMFVATFGHAGDGNVHTTFIMDVRNKSEWKKAEKMAEELVDLAMKLEGTLSAEHGLGVAKAAFVDKELSSSIEVMRKVKSALDPNGILNPGKMSLDGKKTGVLDHFAFSEIAGKKLECFSDDLRDEILVCVQCGFCRNSCPTFDLSTVESKNARGRILLAESLMTGRIQPSMALADRLYSCTVCGACTSACPAGIAVSDIVIACREKLAEAICVPQSHVSMVENIEKEGNPFGSPRKERTDLFPEEYRKSEPEKAEVLLFMGCLPSYLDMDVVPATFKIMEASGVDFTVLGGEENCCGYVEYLVGAPSFQERIESNMEKFNKVDPRMIVTPCAGCYKNLKKSYPKEFMVFHISQFVHMLLEEGKLTLRKAVNSKVIYHDPCDLGRHMGVFDEPREVLKSILGLELIEFPENRENAACCGGGGGLMAYDSQMSLEIARKRVEKAIDSGAQVLVSACASCKDSLRKGLRKVPKDKRDEIFVTDLTEIIAEAI